MMTCSTLVTMSFADAVAYRRTRINHVYTQCERSSNFSIGFRYGWSLLKEGRLGYTDSPPAKEEQK